MAKLLRKNKIAAIDPPCKKMMYNSYEDANDIIRYIEENRGGKKLRAYKCDICGFWHLTSSIE